MRTSRDRFADAAGAPEADGRLAEAALCLAAEADPTVDVDAELAALAELADGCPPDLEGLRAHLFERHGFHGNTGRYADPRNSYLHLVRRRRTGIPISLAVVAMEVGRGAGVPLVGIGLPGHFVTRSADDPSAYLDAFHGRVMTVDGIRRLVMATVGADLEPGWLVPMGPPAILQRMLNNLRPLFQRHFDWPGMLWTADLELMLPNAGEESHALRAVTLTRLGRGHEAAEEWEVLASAARDRGDDDRAGTLARQARGARATLQ